MSCVCINNNNNNFVHVFIPFVYSLVSCILLDNNNNYNKKKKIIMIIIIFLNALYR